MRLWVAYTILVLLSCLPGGSGPATVDDPGPDDTALAIRPKMAGDTVPGGCRVDSLGRVECPDIRPEGHP